MMMTHAFFYDDIFVPNHDMVLKCEVLMSFMWAVMIIARDNENQCPYSGGFQDINMQWVLLSLFQ